MKIQKHNSETKLQTTEFWLGDISEKQSFLSGHQHSDTWLNK